MIHQVKRFFYYNAVAILVAVQLVVLMNYWYFIYRNITTAAINDTIVYQGKLVDSTSVAIDDGDYNLRFKIYDAASNGTLLWSETWNGTDQNPNAGGTQGDLVTIADGIFTVELNSLCSSWTNSNATCVSSGTGANFNSADLYLQVEMDVDGEGAFEEIFTPRKRFSSTAYAMNADKLDGNDVGTTGAVIPLLSTANYWSGGQFYTSGVSHVTLGSVYTASKSTTTVTATVGTFSATDVGKLLVWADGTVDRIMSFTDSTHVVVAASATIASSSATTYTPNLFVDSSGRLISGTGIASAQSTIVGTQSNVTYLASYVASKTDTTVTATVGTFAATDVGKFLIWTDGTIDKITAYTSSTVVSVNDTGTIASTSAQSYTANMYITSGGLTGIGTVSPSAQLEVVASSSSVKPLVIRGAASQSANLTEWQNNSGSNLASVDSSGLVTTPELNASTQVVTPVLSTSNSINGAAPTVGGANQVSYWTMDDDRLRPVSTNTDLRAYYDFTEGSGSTLGDSTANNNDCTFAGNTAWNSSTPFASGNSLVFDGTGDWVNCGTSTSLNLTGDYTVSIWFKTSTNFTTVAHMITRFNDGLNNGWLIGINASEQLYFTHKSGAGVNTASSTSSYSDGNWHMAALTFESGVGSKLYVDGSQVASNATTTTAIPTYTQNLRIGAQDYSTPRAFTGSISFGGLYNNDLSAAEILRMYNKSLSTKIADYVGVNHGSITGASFTTGAYGYTGDYALNFGGGSYYSQAADHSSLNTLTNGTVTLWYKPNYSGSPSSISGLFSKSSTSASVALYGAYHSTDGNLYFNLNDTAAVNCGAFSPTTSTWYHLAFVWDGTNAICYLDGAALGTVANSNGSGTSARPFFIGAYVYNSESTKQYALGLVDNVILSNDDLSSSQVQTEYNSAFSGTGLVFDTQNEVLSSDAKLFSVRNVGVERLYVGLDLIGLTGESAKTIKIDRISTSNTAGKNLTVSSGGATVGATDKNGGDLYLTSGLSTGTGTSKILLQTYPAGSTGTSDNTALTRLSILSDGSIGIYNSSGNYVGFKAPTSISSNLIWTLPASDGTNGQVLSTDGSGALSWATGASTGFYHLIETLTVGSAVTTQDLAATLNGNSEGAYRLEFHIVNGSGSNTLYGLRLNGASTAGTRQITTSAGTSITAANDTTIYVTGAGTATSTITEGEMELRFPQTGLNKRTYHFEAASDVAGVQRQYTGVFNYTTPSTSTNITSIGFVANTASGIGAGSIFKLYKLQ